MLQQNGDNPLIRIHYIPTRVTRRTVELFCSREDCFLTLDTRSVNVVQWSVALASIFVGFTFVVVGFGMYLPDDKKLSTTAFIFLITFGFVMLLLSSGAVVFFHRKHSNRTLKRVTPSI